MYVCEINWCSCSMLSKLRSFASCGSSSADYKSLLTTMCNWKKGNEILELISDWLEPCLASPTAPKLRVRWLCLWNCKLFSVVIGIFHLVGRSPEEVVCGCLSNRGRFGELKWFFRLLWQSGSDSSRFFMWRLSVVFMPPCYTDICQL